MPSSDANKRRTLKNRELLRARASVTFQGKKLTLKIETNQQKFRKPKKRKAVRVFSRAARLRMLKFIATVQWDDYPTGLFVTLTYPDSVVRRTMDDRRMDRRRFLRDTEKHLGHQVKGLWRLEWEPRKSGLYVGQLYPHYHMMLLGETFYWHETCRKIWRKILRVKGPLDILVKAMPNAELTGFYIAEYMAGITDPLYLDNPSYWNTSGLHWGKIRRHQIAMAQEQTLEHLTDQQLDYLLTEAARKLPWVRPGEQTSFTFLGKHAVEAKRILDKMLLDAKRAG